jgi:hypothetical protein
MFFSIPLLLNPINVRIFCPKSGYEKLLASETPLEAEAKYFIDTKSQGKLNDHIL